MKHTRSILFVLLGFCLPPVNSQVQTITMDEFLDQLKQGHPFFEKERLKVQAEKEEQNGYLGDQDWNVFYSGNLIHEEPAFAFTGVEKTNAISVDGNVERVFWKTGGRLSASFSTIRSDIDLIPAYSAFGFPTSFYQNELAITYRHPLLKNKNGFLDKLQYDLKQYDIDFSEVQAIENQEEFLAAVAIKFLDWVLLTEQKEIIRDRLKLSREELVRTKKKQTANLVDKVDVIRAEDAVRIAQQNRVLIESQWKGLQAELAILSQNDELYRLIPEFNLYEFQEFISLEDATSRLITNSRLMKTLTISISQLGYARKGFEEVLKPDLSLLAQFNTKRLDKGLGKSLLMNKPDAVMGLQFSVPLGNRTVRSRITKTDIQTAQLERQMDDLSLNLTSALVNLYIQIQGFENVLQLNLEQIESARAKTQEELRLYDQGRGDLTFVIQSQDSEENAKLTYAKNAATYHKLVIEYMALMDELL